MRYEITKPLPIRNELECPDCKGRYKLTKEDPINKRILCPYCGARNKLVDCLSKDSLKYELYLARKKMQKVVLRSKTK